MLSAPALSMEEVFAGVPRLAHLTAWQRVCPARLTTRRSYSEREAIGDD